jgi:hypothetical protein
MGVPVGKRKSWARLWSVGGVVKGLTGFVFTDLDIVAAEELPGFFTGG